MLSPIQTVNLIYKLTEARVFHRLNPFALLVLLSFSASLQGAEVFRKIFVRTGSSVAAPRETTCDESSHLPRLSAEYANKPLLMRAVESIYSNSLSLIIAVEKNDHILVEELVQTHHQDLKASDCKGTTLLMRAVQLGHIEIARILIKHHAPANAQDLKGRTALMYAVIARSLPLVKDLLDACVDPTKQGRKGESALTLAGDDLALIRELIVNIVDQDHREAYAMHAAKAGYVDIVCELWKHIHPRAAAQSLVVLNQQEKLRPAIKKMISRNFYNKRKILLSYLAITRLANARKVPVVEALLLSGVQVDLSILENLCESASMPDEVLSPQTLDGHYLEAAKEGKSVLMEGLVALGANLLAEDRHRQTALMWAALGGHEDTVEMLLQTVADKDHDKFLNAQDFYGRSALQWAADSEQFTLVKKLLDSGSIVQDNYATRKLLVKIAQYHLDAHNDNLFFSDLFKRIVALAKIDPLSLYSFAKKQNYKALFSLVAPMLSDDFKSQELIEAVYWSPNMPLAEDLLQAGADPNVIVNQGTPLLEWTVLFDLDIYTVLLLRYHAKVNALGATHGTALHMAAGRGKVAIVELLLRAGADQTIRNEMGHTALMQAGYYGKTEVVAYLKKYASQP